VAGRLSMLSHEERVWVTPDLVCCAEEADVEARVKVAREVVQVLRGEKPRSPVNQIK
jgi:phosphoglycerate dehydrogenase-like enzyme